MAPVFSYCSRFDKTVQTPFSRGVPVVSLGFAPPYRCAKLHFASTTQSTRKQPSNAKNTSPPHRLVCHPDEQDPALVVVGRRSFGGFNSVAEAAYTACIREIAAGERLGQADQEGEDEGGGISDAEMAER